MIFFFLAKTSKLWSCSWWFFPKLPKPFSSSWPYPQSHGLLLLRVFQSSQSCFLLHGFFKSSQSSQSCALLIFGFFSKLHGYDLLPPSQNPEVVVFFVMVFSKVPKVVFFFLAVPLKPWSSFSWIFPKFPKLLFSSWFFPKLHGCGLLVLLLVVGQHAHCFIQLQDYS